MATRQRKKPESEKSRLDYLCNKLDSLHAQIKKAETAKSWQAVSSLHKEARYTRESLDELRSHLADSERELPDTPDDLIDALKGAMLSLPMWIVEDVFSTIVGRFPGFLDEN